MYKFQIIAQKEKFKGRSVEKYYQRERDALRCFDKLVASGEYERVTLGKIVLICGFPMSDVFKSYIKRGEEAQRCSN